jgi:hypothetical protein
MGAAPAPAVVPPGPPDYITNPNAATKWFVDNFLKIDLSKFTIEIDGVLKQCAIDVQKVREGAAPVIDPALCVQLDQLLAQQSGDHQGDNNHGDLFSPFGKTERKS